MKKYILTLVAVVAPLLILVNTFKGNKDLDSVSTELLNHYKADKVVVYELFQKGDLPVKLFHNYTHIKCVSEVMTEGILALCENQQEVPIIAVIPNINKIVKDGIYAQPSIKSEKIQSIKNMGTSLAVRSSYSVFVENRMGKPIAIISLNFNRREVDIEDYTKLYSFADEMGEILEK